MTRDARYEPSDAPTEAPVWQRHRHGHHPRRPPAGARTVSLQDVLTGRAAAREDSRQITFSERGNIQGAQFHAVAALVYERARKRGLGREVPLDWLLQDIRD
ncbi:hypothetical protein [Streptomyces ochraceiscleroticus]|uniref:Uncharacterized protein n=1 Tax=Streptomyces ochraceiscleroticus TaxID=47761 RepID=A0ABW1MS04_9ACTN|nr:hypothetical protein [Streptomyces ochraceiscleroticus]